MRHAEPWHPCAKCSAVCSAPASCLLAMETGRQGLSMLWTSGEGGKRAARNEGGAVFGAWPAVMLMSLHTISSCCCRQWQAAQSGSRSLSLWLWLWLCLAWARFLRSRSVLGFSRSGALGPYPCSGICACHFNYGKYLMHASWAGRRPLACVWGRGHVIINAKISCAF